MFNGVVRSVNMFRRCSADVALALLGALKSHMYLPGDHIVRYGETGTGYENRIRASGGSN